MNDNDKNAIREILLEVIEENKSCLECPLDTVEYQKERLFLQWLIETYSRTTTTAWGVIVKSVITFIISLIAMGILFVILKYGSKL